MTTISLLPSPAPLVPPVTTISVPPPTPPPLPAAPLGSAFFSPTSVWNQQLAVDAALDPNSAAITGHLNEFVNAGLATRTGPWINTSSFSTPIYTVGAAQPTVPVYMDQYNPSLTDALSSVPIPADAQPAAGGDAQMTIYQPSSDTLWELFGMRQSLRPPEVLSAAVAAGGALPLGSYYYGVTALSAQGETTPSPIQGYAVPADGLVNLHWQGPIGSTGYRIYRGSDPQHLLLIATIAHQTFQLHDPATIWSDDGSQVPAAVSPPAINTAATPGQWHASWGGRLLNVSTDPGYYRRILDPTGAVIEDAGWGATASSLPLVGGLITLADLASGHIDHALAMLVPMAKAKTFYFPAQRTDGVDTSPDAVPEGARFRLDPTLDLSALPMAPITRMIAEAAQKYGVIVNDQTGASVGFRAEDPTPLIRSGQSNPYLRYFANPANGQYEAPNQLLQAFPWSHLELLAQPPSG